MADEIQNAANDVKAKVSAIWTSIKNFIVSRAKAIYLAVETKIALLDKLVNELISDLSSNRNRILLGCAVGVLLIFKFTSNFLFGLIAFVALLAVIATWLIFYNRNGSK